MALLDIYRVKKQDFVALKNTDKAICFHELQDLHAQLHAEKELVLPPICPMRAGVIYDSQIVGVYYAQSGKILAAIPEFTELELRPDPQNPVDNMAVKIMYRDAHLGFVPKVINKVIFSALTTGKNVICLMQRYIPAVERNNEFSPERASITIHIIHLGRIQKIFMNLMDIYALTYPNLPPNWVQAMVTLGEVVVPMLENYLSFHPEISAKDVIAQVKNQFLA